MNSNITTDDLKAIDDVLSVKADQCKRVGATDAALAILVVKNAITEVLINHANKRTVQLETELERMGANQ